MPKAYIDGVELTFEGRPKLLQLCLDHGVELPHFCYHPAMSAPANCRQCLVQVGMPARDRATGETVLNEDGTPQIQYMPKLQTSCSMDVSDGMVVNTHRTSDEVARAQKDTLEFLLINHPLDCPICDQAGNCPLQIQAYKYGPEGSRFEFEKVHKPKHIELGPNVVLDGERCINCTRCVRFTDEISGSKQLTIIERGVRNFPVTPPGVSFDDPYSMNVIDICPVGALTSHDFRFKARAWEMSATPSITDVNAKGSNCEYWVKDNLITRVTARTNESVNGHWLADEDRLDYKKFNENRASGATVSGKPVSWETAYAAVADALSSANASKVRFIGSAFATVEDNYLLRKLAAHVGAPVPSYIPHVTVGHADGWLRTDDRTPNTQGCERLGLTAVDATTLQAQLAAGEIDVLYVMEEDPVAAGICTAESLSNTKVIVHAYHTTNQTAALADIVLPAAMIVETVGTYVNCDGHAQRVRPAKAIASNVRTLMMETGKSRHDQHGTPFDRWHNESNKVDCQPGWTALPEIASRLGLDLSFVKGPKQIMSQIEAENPAFAGATYDAMGLSGVRLSEIGQLA